MKDVLGWCLTAFVGVLLFGAVWYFPGPGMLYGQPRSLYALFCMFAALILVITAGIPLWRPWNE